MRLYLSIARPYLRTSLKFLKHAFFYMSKMDINLPRRVVFRKPSRPANVFALMTPNWLILLASFPKFSLQQFFWNANDWVVQTFKQYFF